MFMENMNPNPPRQPNPRRRKRDPKRVFFEAYFPVLLAAAVLVVIIAVVIINSSKSKEQQERDRKAAVDRVLTSAAACGFEAVSVIPSPVEGGDGNREFLAYFVKKA